MLDLYMQSCIVVTPFKSPACYSTKIDTKFVFFQSIASSQKVAVHDLFK